MKDCAEGRRSPEEEEEEVRDISRAQAKGRPGGIVTAGCPDGNRRIWGELVVIAGRGGALDPSH